MCSDDIASSPLCYWLFNNGHLESEKRQILRVDILVRSERTNAGRLLILLQIRRTIYWQLLWEGWRESSTCLYSTQDRWESGKCRHGGLWNFRKLPVILVEWVHGGLCARACVSVCVWVKFRLCLRFVSLNLFSPCAHTGKIPCKINTFPSWQIPHTLYRSLSW